MLEAALIRPLLQKSILQRFYKFLTQGDLAQHIFRTIDSMIFRMLSTPSLKHSAQMIKNVPRRRVMCHSTVHLRIHLNPVYTACFLVLLPSSAPLLTRSGHAQCA